MEAVVAVEEPAERAAQVVPAELPRRMKALVVDAAVREAVVAAAVVDLVVQEDLRTA
jgi:hypothetical protein